MRALACMVVLGLVPAGAQELPSWFRALQGLPGLESRFEQQADSAVFKQMSRKGVIRVAPGGKLRVEYHRGSLLVSDGRLITQYDPATRTAQRLDLQATLKDAPLLALLLDPSRISDHYTAKVEGQKVRLQPKAKGGIAVELTGQGALLSTVTWTDHTGARQVLTLVAPELKRSFPAGTFNATLPKGTRWVQ